MLLIDKPKGITSFDVIRVLRKQHSSLGNPIPKLGHAGTLDPLASGLLIMAVGEETKALKDYVGLPKTYEVEALIGERRETGDMEGRIVQELAVDKLDEVGLKKAVRSMVGVHELPVPKYSAVKQGGEPLYKKVRRKEEVSVPIRKMEIYTIDVRKVTCTKTRCIVSLVMEVSSGSYVRTFVEEFGRRLGYPATTKELRRTRIGIFDVRDAVSPKEITL